jgi:hypothetical protein
MDATTPFRRALLRRFLSAAGLTALAMPSAGLVGCGGTAVVEQGGAGGAGGAGSTTSVTSSDASSVSSSADSSASSSVNSSTAVSSTVSTNASSGTGQVTEVRCVPPDANGTCPSGDAALPYINQFDCVDPDYMWTTSVVSGPWQDEGGQCCYEVTMDFCGVGRPLRLNGAPVLAKSQQGGRWGANDVRPRVTGLSPEARQSLAATWERDGALEHASVAAFARFSLELLALGAPADLVTSAHEAALDEVRHARDAFALASAYRGEGVEPGPLPLGDSLPLARSLAELARAAVSEGIVGETIASLLAAEEAALTDDPAVRAVLATVASDEARHAELAVRAVAWALRTGGADVRSAVAEAFEAVLSGSAKVPVAPGRLPTSTLEHVARRAVVEVLAPCATGLLGLGAKPAAVEAERVISS